MTGISSLFFMNLKCNFPKVVSKYTPHKKLVPTMRIESIGKQKYLPKKSLPKIFLLVITKPFLTKTELNILSDEISSLSFIYIPSVSENTGSEYDYM